MMQTVASLLTPGGTTALVAKPGIVPPPRILPPPDATPPAPLILFGRDERGKPHASRFAGDAVDGAADAARLMGLHRAVADTEALQGLAAQLPAGRLFPSGKAFVPFVAAALYQRLLAATGTADMPLPVSAAGKPAEPPPGSAVSQGGGAPAGGAGGAAKPPFDWADIARGSLVLARGDADDDGYYVASVVATRADNHLVLTWRDYPDLPEFSRHRHALGLLHPGMPTKGG